MADSSFTSDSVSPSMESTSSLDKELPLPVKCTDDINDVSTADNESLAKNKSPTETESSGVVSDTLKVLVGRVNTGSRKSFEFPGGATIQNLVEKIKLEFKEKENEEITVYELPAIEGNITKPKVLTVPLDKYNNKELVFHVKGRGLSTDAIAELKSNACGQNIACLGAPGHGKSSFINTIFKSLGKRPCAPTFTGSIAGTVVFTPYPVETEGVKFTLWDVPGAAVKAVKDGKLKDTIENILRGKQQPNVKIELGKQWTEKDDRKVHAVLAIHDGQSEIDKMHSVFRDVANSLGRAIPFFMVVTHIDEMNPEAIEATQKLLSTTFGIDRGNIFTIANYDHTGKSFRSGEDPQRDFYVRNMLMQVLSESKFYKENAKLNASSCVVI